MSDAFHVTENNFFPDASISSGTPSAVSGARIPPVVNFQWVEKLHHGQKIFVPRFQCPLCNHWFSLNHPLDHFKREHNLRINSTLEVPGLFHDAVTAARKRLALPTVYSAPGQQQCTATTPAEVRSGEKGGHMPCPPCNAVGITHNSTTSGTDSSTRGSTGLNSEVSSTSGRGASIFTSDMHRVAMSVHSIGDTNNSIGVTEGNFSSTGGRYLSKLEATSDTLTNLLNYASTDTAIIAAAEALLATTQDSGESTNRLNNHSVQRESGFAHFNSHSAGTLLHQLLNHNFSKTPEPLSSNLITDLQRTHLSESEPHQENHSEHYLLPENNNTTISSRSAADTGFWSSSPSPLPVVRCLNHLGQPLPSSSSSSSDNAKLCTVGPEWSTNCKRRKTSHYSGISIPTGLTNNNSYSPLQSAEITDHIKNVNSHMHHKLRAKDLRECDMQMLLNKKEWNHEDIISETSPPIETVYNQSNFNTCSSSHRNKRIVPVSIFPSERTTGSSNTQLMDSNYTGMCSKKKKPLREMLDLDEIVVEALGAAGFSGFSEVIGKRRERLEAEARHMKHAALFFSSKQGALGEELSRLATCVTACEAHEKALKNEIHGISALARKLKCLRAQVASQLSDVYQLMNLLDKSFNDSNTKLTAIKEILEEPLPQVSTSSGSSSRSSPLSTPTDNNINNNVKDIINASHLPSSYSSLLPLVCKSLYESQISTPRRYNIIQEHTETQSGGSDKASIQKTQKPSSPLISSLSKNETITKKSAYSATNQIIKEMKDTTDIIHRSATDVDETTTNHPEAFKELNVPNPKKNTFHSIVSNHIHEDIKSTYDDRQTFNHHNPNLNDSRHLECKTQLTQFTEQHSSALLISSTQPVKTCVCLDESHDKVSVCVNHDKNEGNQTHSTSMRSLDNIPENLSFSTTQNVLIEKINSFKVLPNLTANSHCCDTVPVLRNSTYFSKHSALPTMQCRQVQP